MTPLLREEIDHRYRLVSELGSGGMGVVYKALDRLSREFVALKRVTTAVTKLDFAAGGALSRSPARRLDSHLEFPTLVEPAGDAESTAHSPTMVDGSTANDRSQSDFSLLRGIASEFQTLVSLRHPNIISVLSYGFDSERQPYYTMELLSDPKNFLAAARGKTVDEKIELLAQVLRALSYLHRRGIVHRDLKPDNVLVDREAKVLDFGLAVRPGEHQTGMFGTPTHISPEVVRGEGPTAACDLYAVGVMAYEILAGQHPFDAGNVAGNVAKMLEDHVQTEPDWSKLPVGEDIAQVIRGLLEKDPIRRGDRANDVLADLSRAASIELTRETRSERESYLQTAEFVGRSEEKAYLVDALKEAMSGRGDLLLVEGQSGVGKSRLLEELRTEALVRGVSVIKTQAASHRQAFALWQQPMRQLALSTELSDEEGATLKLLLPGLELLVERDLPDVEFPPANVKAELLKVIQSVFECQQEPLLLLLEDLHEADESLDVLRALSEKLSTLPILVVGSYRSEETPRLVEELPLAKLVHLASLPADDISKLSRSMLGSVGTKPEVVEFLEKHTEGNAFFIVETVRALAEEAGGLSNIGRLPLPENIAASGVQNLVQRRLSRLPKQHRPLLEWAAVVGRELDRSLLESAFDPREVSEGIASAADLALLEARESAWRFSHDKFREVLESELAPESKAFVHMNVGKTIEKIYGATDESSVRLAYHFGNAGDFRKEAKYSELAGQATIRRGAYQDATRLLGRALDLQPLLASAEPEKELDLLLLLGSALIATRGWSAPEVKENYDAAVALGKELGQESKVGPALIGLCKVSFLRGKLEPTLNLARQCIQLAEAAGDPIMRQHGLLMAGEVGVWLGEFAENRGYAREIFELYDPEQVPVHLSLYGQDPRITCMVSATYGTWMLGHPGEAQRMHAEIVELAREQENAFSLAIAHQVGAWLNQLRGDVSQTLSHARDLRQISEESGFLAFVAMAKALEGWAMARRNDPGSGLARLREGVQSWFGLGANLGTTFYAALEADACLQAGLLDEGLSCVGKLLDGLTRCEERCYNAELHRLRGELLLAARENAAAEEAFEAAVAVAAQQEAKSFELRATLSLCRLLGDSPAGTSAQSRLSRLLVDFEDSAENKDLIQARDLLNARSEGGVRGMSAGEES